HGAFVEQFAATRAALWGGGGMGAVGRGVGTHRSRSAGGSGRFFASLTRRRPPGQAGSSRMRMDGWLTGVRAVVFDAVGTLITPDPPAPAVYAEVGRKFGSRLGVEVIAARFRAAFRAGEETDRAAGW